LVIPYGEELINPVQHRLAACHVGFFGRVGVWQAFNLRGLLEEPVVCGVMIGREALSVGGGRDDDFEVTSPVQDLFGEDAVRAIGKKRHSGQRRRQLIERVSQSFGYEL
jgi:hypothetical protein